MNEKDREYLKNNIEKKLDNIDKKVSSPSTTAKTLKELYSEQSKERRKLIEDYKKQDDNGEATLAQKIELLKASIETSIPKDFKDGMKAMGNTMKKGANQALSGASNLTGRVMGLTPLTALLWQNRDIAKAFWDMGIGGAKMGVGLAQGAITGVTTGVKGLYQGAANLLEWNKEKKPKEEEPIPEQTEEKPVVLQEQEMQPKEEDYVLSTVEKISEIHEYLLKKRPLQEIENQKQEKSRHLILSKGLTGIGKTMKTVSDVIETIMAKQKLILGGVLMGAVGILALVGWIKNGGMDRLFDKFKQSMASDEGRESRKKADDYLKSEYKKIAQEASATDKMVEEMDIQQSQNVFNVKEKDFKGNAAEQKQAKRTAIINNLSNVGITGEHARNLIMKHESGTLGLDANARKLKNTQPISLILPFDTFINSYNILSVDETHVDFQLSRGQGANMKAVYFTNAIKSSVKAGKKPRNTVIAKLDVNSVVFGDWNGFLGVEEGKTLQDTITEERAPEIAKKYNEIIDEPFHKPGFTDGAQKAADTVAGVYRQLDAAQVKEALSNKGKVPEKDKKTSTQNISSGNAPTTEQIEDTNVTETKIPQNNVNQSNKVDKQVKQQEEQINKAQKANAQTTTEEKVATKTQDTSPNKLALNVNKSTPSQYPEYFNTGQYYAATDV